jgi:hypothetical protein
VRRPSKCGRWRVEALLSYGEALGDDGLHGIRDMGQDVRENLSLALGKILQHEVGGVLATRGAPHADAHTREVGTTTGGNDVAQTVMTTVTAAMLDAHDVEIQIKLVMQNDQLGWFEAVKLEEGRYGATRKVHKRVGLGQNDLGAAGLQPALGDKRICFVRAERRAHVAGQLRRGHLPHVVAMAGVAGPGVTEPDDKPRVFRQRSYSA